MSNIPYRALTIVSAVVRTASFSQAAAELNVSQSAVSNAIRRLETRLGERLFERRGGRISPLPLAVRLSTAVDEAEALLCDAMPDAEPQQITISAAPTLAARWLAPRLRELRSELAPIDVRVKTEIELTDDADVMLRHGVSEDWPELISQPMLDEIKVPVCSPALTSLRSSEAVATLPLIAIDARPEEWSNWAALNGISKLPDPTLTFEVTATAWEAAIAGSGVVLGNVDLLRPELERGDLVQLGTRERTGRRYWCCTKSNNQNMYVRRACNWFMRASRPSDALSNTLTEDARRRVRVHQS